MTGKHLLSVNMRKVIQAWQHGAMLPNSDTHLDLYHVRVSVPEMINLLTGAKMFAEVSFSLY